MELNTPLIEIKQNRKSQHLVCILLKQAPKGITVQVIGAVVKVKIKEIQQLKHPITNNNINKL